MNLESRICMHVLRRKNIDRENKKYSFFLMIYVNCQNFSCLI